MTGPSILSRTPLCLNCLRRTIGDDISQSFFPFHRQVRGKKKKTAQRPTTINVKLLQDIPGYGRKGSITPVEPGRMRNTWYPRQRAEYMTAATLQGVKPQAVVAERDFAFGVKPKEEEAPKASQKDTPVEVQTKLLPPLIASEIMESALPSHIIFYRTPIAEPETPLQGTATRSRRAASSAAAELDAASEPVKPPRPQVSTIFGSVSTADIADSMKAVLAQARHGARVVIGPEDITILAEMDERAETHDIGIEGDRIKALGDFKVEARVKGGEAVARTVSVRAQEIIPKAQEQIAERTRDA